jgi:hypothetical protein
MQESSPLGIKMNFNLQNFSDPITKEYKTIDCGKKVLSLAWRQRNTGGNPVDKNKFVIYTNEGHI